MTQSVRRPILRILCIFIMLCVFSVLTACGAKKEPVTRSGFYFDTVISFTLYGDPDKLSPVFKELFSLCGSYEHMFSATLEGSDLWNINHANAAPVTVQAETFALIKDACSYSELTNGLIDPTITPVSALWNFNRSDENLSYVIPEKGALLEALTHVNYQNIILDEDTCTVMLADPDTALELGFIAKGYITDRLKEYLLSKNITNGILNLGGNTYCLGAKPDGSDYRIGIQYPFGASGDVIASVSVHDKSVVTSGVYERCFEEGGTLYHHILDPRTGYPVRNGLLSVTVISSSSEQADALSTVCFVLGLTEGMKLIESLDGAEALFITDDYTLHYSSGF